MTNHVATAFAYELKTGGFRGVLTSKGTTIARSEVVSTLEAARHFAKSAAWTHFSSCDGFSIAAAYRGKYPYIGNVWIAAA